VQRKGETSPVVNQLQPQPALRLPLRPLAPDPSLPMIPLPFRFLPRPSALSARGDRSLTVKLFSTRANLCATNPSRPAILSVIQLLQPNS
jgi:hypothetical protein